MKIKELIEMLNEAVDIKAGLDVIANDCVMEGDCFLPSERVKRISKVLGDLIEFAENCEMQ